MNAWLVWSNQRGMWWRATHSGYTQHIAEAGRYTEAEAQAIVAQATVDGALIHRRADPVTGREYEQYDEVAVLAPSNVDYDNPIRSREDIAREAGAPWL